ncbi:MAG TPA: M15 family metallopeptidase [Acidimicrobiales bacterium]|nr:M15 family metallopeptidase [Acidimicrobiales bacterium]
MWYVERGGSALRRPRVIAGVAAVVVGAILAGYLVKGASAGSSGRIGVVPNVAVDAVPSAAAPPGRADGSAAPGLPDRLPQDQQAGLSEDDGVVSAGVTVFDARSPAVARLDPALLGALRRAATDAGRAGITFYVDSGWRSAAYQQRLLREAVAKYGSEAEAARWVATPDTSAHVSGDAVDLGRSDATQWLAKHGASYGLCQIYRNEPWHYELRPGAVDHGCPAMYADAAHDPRMQR